ncbi:MAG: ATP-binding protein [Gammaproteobacteria bacterium]|jgi:predicted AAA+ superfamily ATPase|nr:ATP-binding protein [Gammaproteobacteria bacterium]
MERLFEIQNLLINQFDHGKFYARNCFNAITYDNRLTGIVGARGIGKTTFLLHQAMLKGAEQKKALYVSADSYYLLETPLLELVDKLYKETDVRLLCVDEIQKYTNWNQELKNISDTYKNFRVLFTGSSMIDLIKAKYDLSRRATMHHLYGLSFREYLEFTQNFTLPIISLDELIKNHESIAHDLKIPTILKLFTDYLRIGYYPFFNELRLDQEKFQAIENAVQKAIYEDIATLYSLKTPTLLIIEKLYKYVVGSLPGEVSAYKLANALNKDYESISEYLHILEQAGLIRFIYTEKQGKAALRNPTKMYPDNSNLIFSAYLPQSLDEAKGKVRETFVINQFKNSHHEVFYSDQGDFKVEKLIFEVGGKNKSTAQLKGNSNGYVLADGILVGYQNKIPLYLLGFLY